MDKNQIFMGGKDRGKMDKNKIYQCKCRFIQEKIQQRLKVNIECKIGIKLLCRYLLVHALLMINYIFYC